MSDPLLEPNGAFQKALFIQAAPAVNHLGILCTVVYSQPFFFDSRLPRGSADINNCLMRHRGELVVSFRGNNVQNHIS